MVQYIVSFLGLLWKLLNVNAKCYYKYGTDLCIQNMNGIQYGGDGGSRNAGTS